MRIGDPRKKSGTLSVMKGNRCVYRGRTESAPLASVFPEALGELARFSGRSKRLTRPSLGSTLKSRLGGVSGLCLKRCLLLEALRLGESLILGDLNRQRRGRRSLLLRGTLAGGTDLTEQHREKGGADLGGLETLFHQTVGELGLVCETTGGEDLADLLEENFRTPSLDLGGSRDDAAADAGMGELLKVLDLVDVAAADKGRRHALATGTAGTADAVDVVLGIMGKVVVDHHLEVVDVDAACGDIRGDKELEFRVLELVHHSRALGLGDAAVETVRGESLR